MKGRIKDLQARKMSMDWLCTENGKNGCTLRSLITDQKVGTGLDNDKLIEVVSNPEKYGRVIDRKIINGYKRKDGTYSSHKLAEGPVTLSPDAWEMEAVLIPAAQKLYRLSEEGKNREKYDKAFVFLTANLRKIAKNRSTQHALIDDFRKVEHFGEVESQLSIKLDISKDGDTLCDEVCEAILRHLNPEPERLKKRRLLSAFNSCKLGRLALQHDVTLGDAAKKLGTSEDALLDAMLNPPDRITYMRIYRAIMEIDLSNQQKADVELGTTYLTVQQVTRKYVPLYNKHLGISIPMQTNGMKYTGQQNSGYDYYEGRYVV
jgi:hypothetical protein